jgi:hypothetical protein
MRLQESRLSRECREPLIADLWRLSVDLNRSACASLRLRAYVRTHFNASPAAGDVPMGDVAGKKRPRPESQDDQDDQSRDETEGVVMRTYVCRKDDLCAGCKKKKDCPAGNMTRCLRPLHAKTKIPGTLANRALEGVALPDAASLRDLAKAPLTDWGVGQPEAGALVVTINPPGIGVVVEVHDVGHRKVKVVGRADVLSRRPKFLRPFVGPELPPSVDDDTPPLITATLVRPNVVFQRYVPRSRNVRARIAHTESVQTCTSKYTMPGKKGSDFEDFIRSLASGLSTIRKLPATLLELTTAANVATKREHCIHLNENGLLQLVNMGQKMNLWDVTLASGAQSRSMKLSASQLRFAPGSGEAPTDEPGNVCPLSGKILPTWVNSVSFSGELVKGLRATVNMQRCPCGHHRTGLEAMETKARNTKALVLKEAYAKALVHADAGHHGSGAELLRAAISALER